MFWLGPAQPIPLANLTALQPVGPEVLIATPTGKLAYLRSRHAYWLAWPRRSARPDAQVCWAGPCSPLRGLYTVRLPAIPASPRLEPQGRSSYPRLATLCLFICLSSCDAVPLKGFLAPIRFESKPQSPKQALTRKGVSLQKMHDENGVGAHVCPSLSPAPGQETT